MFTLPPDDNTIFELFKPYFTNRIWSHVQVVLMGAILTPGQRMVTAILRILGLSQETHFQTYHRVLLLALVAAFVLAGPIVLGLDDIIERRRGPKSGPKGSAGIRSVPAIVTWVHL